MNTTKKLRGYISLIGASRARNRTLRILDSLPAELQQDIGYPGIFAGRR